MPHSSFDAVIVKIHRDFHGNLLKLGENFRIISLNFALRILLQVESVLNARSQNDSVTRALSTRLKNPGKQITILLDARHIKLITASSGWKISLSRGEAERKFEGKWAKNSHESETKGEKRCKPTKITVILLFSFFHLIRHQEGNFIILIRTFFFHSRNPRSSSTSFHRNSSATKTINAN